MLLGVGDDTSFHHFGFPTWEAPASDSDKCYFANYDRPAADVAAQVAAALAVVTKVLQEHSTDPEHIDEVVHSFTSKAIMAFEYAADTYLEYGINATCSSSTAKAYCIGECHEGAKSVRSPFILNATDSVMSAASARTSMLTT